MHYLAMTHSIHNPTAMVELLRNLQWLNNGWWLVGGGTATIIKCCTMVYNMPFQHFIIYCTLCVWETNIHEQFQLELYILTLDRINYKMLK